MNSILSCKLSIRAMQMLHLGKAALREDAAKGSLETFVSGWSCG